MSYVVIGAGITGLVAAHCLAQVVGGERVIVIERAPVVGGLLAGCTDPQRGLYFDFGTHIFRESGHADLDRLLVGAIDPALLQRYPTGRGALAGAVIDGGLQAHTHYPDVRLRTDYPELMASLHRRAQAGPVGAIDPTLPLLDVAAERFGAEYARAALGPLLGRLFRTDPETLSAFAMLLPGVTRVVAHDTDDWLASLALSGGKGMFAVPDQRQMPSALENPLQRYYGGAQGTRALADGLAAQLQACGVRILTRCELQAFDPATPSVTWRDAAGDVHHCDAAGVILTAGVVGAAHLLKVASVASGPRHAHLAYQCVLDRPIDSDLSYFYNYDLAHPYFRVTHYGAFSGVQDDCRLTVEVLLPQADMPAPDPASLVTALREVGFLDNHQLVSAHRVSLPGSFPFPTVQNAAMTARAAAAVESLRLPEHVLLLGAGSSQRFFQNDVLIHAYDATREWAGVTVG